MYRILIADDEGLMLEAFKGVILAEFGDKCSVETAKTGRAVIEKAETFHPDIVFMDIHMPGINGIQAMREIRKFNNSALFYVVSAYDKFDYAKEAINLGVEQYLTKPISKSKIISVVEEATAKVDKVRDQRSNLLKIQEKLETVIPVVESGYVNSLLFQKEMAAAGYYQQLLDIEYGQGYVMVVQFGQSYENGRLVSPVGMNVKAQSFYPEFRDVVKSAFPCVVGNIMSNRIPVVVPCEIFQNPYEDRIDLVEKARELVTRLEGRLDAKFRVGIGRVWEMEELERSYREALRALNGSLSRVIHIEDLSQNGVYDEAFPGNDEKRMFRCLEEGHEEGMLQEVNFFCDWMVEHYSQDMNNIRLKILEFIIWGEMPGKEQFMTELKMKEMQIIHWFGCPNLNCTRERIHLAAMLATDAEMKKNLYKVCRFLAREEIAYQYPIIYEMIQKMFSPDDINPPEACTMFMPDNEPDDEEYAMEA